VLRIVPYAALHFSSFEYYKRLIHKAVERRWPAAANGAGGGSTSSAAPATSHAVWDLIAGSLSGATAVAATYPLDLVRTRLAWATEGQGKHGEGCLG
jgi:solute carrier family 25 protein 16